ncbi:hypothetical protein PMZ80_006108 [Knufia obscura]|uniref:Uncharacterized protein n=2 Tax=Knufia TaxID=430999 RepID=A0AAN8EN66_9EURO|nr:hypothetical protein PMZ80_006108 [Knufia obscura]KAK5954777.1 hypothetical protein OHC33_004503 [Knufia fluminis]
MPPTSILDSSINLAGGKPASSERWSDSNKTRRWAGIEDLPTNISARILQHIAGEASDPMDPSFFSARAGVDRAVKALSAVMAIPALREAASEIGIEDPIGWIKYDLDLNIFCYKEYKRWSFYWWYNPSKETSG